MNVATCKEVRELEFQWTQTFHQSLEDLTKLVGEKFMTMLQEEAWMDNQTRVIIIAGPGHNGEDAEVIFELLRQKYSSVKGFAIGKTRQTMEPISSENWSHFLEALSTSDVVIDGIFGIGLSRRVEGIYQDVIQAINHSNCKIVSIDLPSGMDADNGLVQGIAVKADLVGVVGVLKPGNLLQDALDYAKRFRLIDVGYVTENFPKREWIEKVPLTLPNRIHHSHKYTYGSVLTIGGSVGYYGSVQLAGMAALRTGAGLSMVAIREEEQSWFHQLYPEIIYPIYQNGNIDELLIKKDSIVFGPGILKPSLFHEAWQSILQANLPVVVDAGAIGFISSGMIPEQMVCTPHLGELASLLHRSTKEVQTNLLECVNEVRTKGVFVIKGPVTIIANSQGIKFIQSGNPGLATAGSGDVLTGIIAGLMAQGLSPIASAIQGVAIHGDAANRCREHRGEASMVASDLLEFIPEVIKKGIIR